MTTLLVCAVALLASGLTFFSGFGLGTLLLPAFALFYPVEQAIALTAVVHFLTGGFKLLLVGRHADRRVVWRFGLPALAASFLGAWALLQLTDLPPIIHYAARGREFVVEPARFVVGLLLLCFALAELLPAARRLAVAPRYLPLGGLLSGFFGGLAGMQGALRSAFLVRAGLSAEQFIGTGAGISFLIDLARLVVYVPAFLAARESIDYPVLTAAVVAAGAGALAGSRFLTRVTIAGIQGLVAVMLFVVAVGLLSGVL